MIKENYALPGSHDYSSENFDIDLYKESINVLDIRATNLPSSIIFTVNFEFMAQYADGQRWVKDTAIFTGNPEGELLTEFKRSLIKGVKQARERLRETKLNGQRAE